MQEDAAKMSYDRFKEAMKHGKAEFFENFMPNTKKDVGDPDPEEYSGTKHCEFRLLKSVPPTREEREAHPYLSDWDIVSCRVKLSDELKDLLSETCYGPNYYVCISEDNRGIPFALIVSSTIISSIRIELSFEEMQKIIKLAKAKGVQLR